MPIKENNFNNELSPSGTELLKKAIRNLEGGIFFFFFIYLYLKHSQGQDTKPKKWAFG